MKSKGAISILFAIAALYDGVLGLLFLFDPGAAFRWFDVTPPNHFGYVQFPAGLLITFAIMFLAIAVRPLANRNLIPYGMLLKVSYCGVIFYYWFFQDIPWMWKPFALIDLLFLALFWAAYAAAGKTRG
jgi:hypothetical protein